jgi:hypothetical protein
MTKPKVKIPHRRVEGQLASPIEDTATAAFGHQGHDYIELSRDLEARLFQTLNLKEEGKLNVAQSVNELFPTTESLQKASDILSSQKATIDMLEKQLRSIILRKTQEQNNSEAMIAMDASIEVLLFDLVFIQQNLIDKGKGYCNRADYNWANARYKNIRYHKE